MTDIVEALRGNLVNCHCDAICAAERGCAGSVWPEQITDQAADEITRLRERVAQLERGEYICKKCGLRKDDEHPKGDF